MKIPKAPMAKLKTPFNPPNKTFGVNFKFAKQPNSPMNLTDAPMKKFKGKLSAGSAAKIRAKADRAMGGC